MLHPAQANLARPRGAQRRGRLDRRAARARHVRRQHRRHAGTVDQRRIRGDQPPGPQGEGGALLVPVVLQRRLPHRGQAVAAVLVSRGQAAADTARGGAPVRSDSADVRLSAQPGGGRRAGAARRLTGNRTVWTGSTAEAGLVFGSFAHVPELTNRQILLRRRPTGLVAPGDTELITDPAPEPADGEALVRTTYIGMDAAARTWLDGQPGYLPALQLGDVIRAAGIGEVVASRCDAYKVGDVVTTLTGFQEYVIVRDDIFTTPIPGETDQLAIMSVYGPTGATAYFGMTDIGKPQPGETVVVSAAAGATGPVAGQVAKVARGGGVGLAGGPDEREHVGEG